MKTLERQMAFYAAYHRDAANKFTHFVDVPMIVFGMPRQLHDKVEALSHGFDRPAEAGRAPVAADRDPYRGYQGLGPRRLTSRRD